MLYSHMPDWIYASKDLSASAKLIMQRIFTLSKDGTQHVYINRTVFAESLGMSGRTLTNVFKELEAMNLIQEVQNSNRWDRTRNFKVTDKACKDLENGTSIDVEKIATSTAQNLLSLHQIEIKKDKEGNIYICDDNKKDSTKAKKDIKKVSYPQSSQDCEPLFGSYIAKYQKDHPALLNLPVSMEAEKFFLYWSEKDWKRGKVKIKSLAGCVATWVGNWLDRNERRYPKPLTPKTIEQEIASYQAYGDEFSKFMEKRQGKTELSFEDFQIVAG